MSYHSVRGNQLGYDESAVIVGGKRIAGHENAVGLGNGQTFYVSSAINGSDGASPATALGTIKAAFAKCVANQGDTIVVLPGHAESVSSATGLTANVAGVRVIGLGWGSSRPTITVDTANTATVAVSADGIQFDNLIFVANFLAIAAAITVASAKDCWVTRCEFRDTSASLNFLNIVKTTGSANTADGLTFNDNTVKNLGTSSNNTTILTANTIDRLTLLRNRLVWAVQNDKAIGVIASAGILTNLDAGWNYGYRPNTTTAGGSFINVGGTTSTGFVHHNFIQTLTTTSDLLFTTTVGLGGFENYVSGAVGASGFIIPARDS